MGSSRNNVPLQQTLAETVRCAARTLATVTETPRLDAELLLAHACGLTRAQLLSRLRETLEIPAAFQDYLERRLQFEPIAYILGTWEFFSLEFLLRPPVLVPRPETEHVVEIALDFLQAPERNHLPTRALDLCTGSGCIAVALAKNAPHCALTATDIRPENLELAHENAARHGVSLDEYTGDLYDALPPGTYPFHLIVSNPPYVEDSCWPELSPVIRMHEDPRALLAGPEGLDILRRIIERAPDFLLPHGMIVLEIGETQESAVMQLLRDRHFSQIRTQTDLAGLPRVVSAVL